MGTELRKTINILLCDIASYLFELVMNPKMIKIAITTLSQKLILSVKDLAIMLYDKRVPWLSPKPSQ